MYRQYQHQEHPFAQYTRILGKGKHGTRSLTEEEAFSAFTMILNRQVLPEQLGAFMMLLRVKEESVDELVGFVKAVKHHMNAHHATALDIAHTPNTPDTSNTSINTPSNSTASANNHLSHFSIDLDWSSYAGKKKHHAWYLLSALTLAKQGIKVCMHGARGHTIGRVYSEDLLSAMSVHAPVAKSLADVPNSINQHNFCYVPLRLLQPTLSDIIDMRNIFGLRSPVHTLARLINPFNAPTSMQSIFHPAYQNSHLLAGEKLGYRNSMVIKGDGGEFERNPDARTKVVGLRDGVQYEFRLPMLNSPKSDIETDLSVETLQRVWEDPNITKTLNKTTSNTNSQLTSQIPNQIITSQTAKYALQAITETLALVLVALQKANNYEQAVPMATEMWHSRHD